MPFFWLIYTLLLAAIILPMLMPDRREDFRYFGYIALALVFLYGLYNITFARKKALLVEEDKKNIFAH